MNLRHLFLSIPLILITLSFSCKSPSGPDVPKNPREYTWTIDTLAYPGSFQTLMLDIWGSSPSNLFVVGYSDINRGLMWHFDGKKWTDVKLIASQGGTIQGRIDFSAIYGFGPDNIFAVGERTFDIVGPPTRFLDSSFIAYFDGHQWVEHKVSGGKTLQSIWGSSPNDIWTAGWNTLYHFNGTLWTAFPINLPSQGMQFLNISGNSSNDVYMVGARNDVVQPIDTSAFFLYHFNGTSWNIVDSVVRTTGPPSEERFGRGLFAINNVLYSVEYGVFKRTNSQWERMFYSDWSLVRLRGTDNSNLFAVGTESQVYHYNGTDWYRYPQFKGTEKYFSSVWTNGAEVFVVGNNGLKTYILHGK